ncbi:hypothetical protein EB1_20670 [Empedobacter brevis NBRC 14943 = ATCC 43319]|uniref:Right handed beta helix domain-containing protein n=1 Tax=Empedobacter brevis NBRC 14943 = ATCC 43319 TaxID=1218108 RepID=A0A511NHW4_9FLAO|nr:right-handed parallel beta-helix repeat-containing protein [Empedobacter brevis]GEM52277.1 hypothetical protein EB1_20670 [Empedobacter brevis NBRC 14943 = ATCC 43319]
MKKVFLLFLLTLPYFIFSQTKYLDLTSSLPKNYVKDGSVDYTSYLQKMIDTHNNILFPNFPIRINYNGLKLKSNSVYKFQSKSKLIMDPNDKSGYNMLDSNGKENIKIINAVLVGDKDQHKGTNGEWGFGISIRGSKNITIENAKIYNCFGDGIYIGRLNKKISENIVVSNSYVTNSRRNGLSITSGINIKVCDSKFVSSKGKGPSSGIDIEPNNSSDEISGIVLDNITTERNENWGLLINLVNLRKDNNSNKKVSITISNFTDNESKYGLSFWLNRKNKFTRNVTGSIIFNKVKLNNNKEEPIKYYDTNSNEINLVINDLFVDSNSVNKLNNVIKNYKESDNKIKFKTIK